MTTINIVTKNTYKDRNLDEKDIIDKTTILLGHYLKKLEEQSCLNGYKYNSISLDILFCSSEKTHELNKEYRDKDHSADILTFAVFADDENRFIIDRNINLGEIIIAVDTVEKMTNKDVSLAKNPTQELYFLISHGLMHLLGFDHRDEEEYNFIIEEQRRALEKINYDKI